MKVFFLLSLLIWNWYHTDESEYFFTIYLFFSLHLKPFHFLVCLCVVGKVCHWMGKYLSLTQHWIYFLCAETLLFIYQDHQTLVRVSMRRWVSYICYQMHGRRIMEAYGTHNSSPDHITVWSFIAYTSMSLLWKGCRKEPYIKVLLLPFFGFVS